MTSTPRPPAQTPRANTPGQRVSHGLVALSSAVVLAVYSAGYLRTQAAADRFEAEAAERRPPTAPPAPDAAPLAPVTSPLLTTPPDPPPPPAVVSRPAPAPSAVPAASAARVAAPNAASPVDTSPAAAVAAGSTTSTTAVSAAAEDATAPATAALPPASSSSVPSPQATAPVAVSTVAAATPEATPVAPVTPATPASPARPRYKDGTYKGWGTSRHGDIQAQIVVVDGRITSATIAQCLTRWPCSWIEALPGQVVTRQSPETDFVSGATQSTNAFYYAVVQALGQAALP